VYTQWLNERGGIEADVTVTRLDRHTFRIITSPAAARRDYHWLQKNLDPYARCELTDTTNQYAVIGMMGPNSRDLLQSHSDDDWSNSAFPFATAAQVSVAGIDVFAQRITYVGERGWELYVEVASALALFQSFRNAGIHFEMRLAGYHALDSCRMEKGYRSWGHDINDLDTPAEAGLGFASAMDKPVEFIGRGAVLQQTSADVRRRIMSFRLLEAEPLLYHDEPIYRNGRLAGFVTSASYGHTLGCAVALGCLRADEPIDASNVENGSYEIEIAGQRHAAAASLRPWYDPSGDRIHA
jgi:4-methylaminobutanoate oxidase (formaldehyde-forming)